MNRRELLLGAAAVAAAAAAGGTIAAETHDHKHMHGGASKRNQALIKTAGECVETGQACLHHCLVLLGEGDKSMAPCAKSVSDLIAVCSALQQLVSAESPYLVEMAKLSIKVCEDCEKECKKPEVAKHEECKACAESCAACYKECKKIVG
ncbi:MAG: four-helix bundle copper-binding protein [Nitrosomonadales bacterium]|nr:four-helix bundle copper-binding protein [Nitrosomonadales bacterium]